MAMEHLAAVLLALATSHPGHDDPEEHPPRIAPIGAELHTPPSRLAESLLDRGQPALAARMVARDAVASAEAARVLAAALEELGDPVGARLARERAARLEARR